MSEESRQMSEDEVLARVVYALFLPAALVATNAGIQLARLRRWMEMAYFHETRRRGMTMKEAMAAMEVSHSKMAQLSRQLKANFVEPEVTYELPRRIEYALWSGPMSAERLAQHLKDVETEELTQTLDQLVEDGRLSLVQSDHGTERYQLATLSTRQTWGSSLAKFDGLHNALSAVTDAIYCRFFKPEAPAFARTMTFHIRERDIPELERFFTEGLCPFVIGLDSAASQKTGHADIKTMTLSVLWAPTGASSPPSDGDEP